MAYPTWNQLTPAQQCAALAMNQDNFEQSEFSHSKEWTCLMEDMTDTEREAWLAEMNEQAALL